jgi:hypothetical protein
MYNSVATSALRVMTMLYTRTLPDQPEFTPEQLVLLELLTRRYYFIQLLAKRMETDDKLCAAHFTRAQSYSLVNHAYYSMQEDFIAVHVDYERLPSLEALEASKQPSN